MLTHHSSEDYKVAASAAATAARSRFDAEIERGKTRALAVIEQVNRDVPQDRVVLGKALNFTADANGIKVEFPDKEHTVQGFHRHAIGQAATRAEIPLAYIDKLMAKGDWGRELVAENLNRLYHNGNGARYLARSVKNEVRGFLSDAYRRMDSRPILESFIAGVQKFGAVPVEGYALDTKVCIKVVLPMASAVQDIVQGTLAAPNVNRYLDAIKTANEEKIDIHNIKDFLAKNLNKAEATAVIDAFNSPEVEMLPPGNTTWRMSNAISWIANTSIEDEERKLEVMKVAGSLLDKAAPKAA